MPGTQPCLRSVNLSVPEGQLLAVVGRVGSGKSSLISALLGNLEHVTGSINIRGTIAYVPQEPWILNATLRQNILFGKQLNQQKYDAVIHACALRPDLDILPAGDLTEIGEKGINLSGGQRQRVALARAVYSDADIYILDDPLSAVDAYVGKHIFQYVIASHGLLANKTRILISHAVQWLPEADRIVVMDSGRIIDSGTYDDLVSREGKFARLLQEIGSERQHANESQSDAEAQHSTASEDRQTRTTPDMKDQDKEDVGRIIEDEIAATGNVKWSVYWSYIRAVGIAACSLVLLMYICYHSFTVVASVWLAKWTDDQDLGNATLPANSSYRFEKNSYYLGVYGAFGGLQALAVFGYSWTVAIRLVVASRALYSNMFHSVMRSPMTFFDTTPTGRIMNRFSKDINSVDEELPDQFGSWIDSLCSLLAIVVVVSYSTPIFLTVVAPITVLYFLIQAFYVKTSRQLKRLESTTRSPIFSHFTETMSGVEVIRSFNEEKRFTEELCEKADLNQSVCLASAAASRWLGIFLETVGNLAVLAAAMFAVADRDSLTGGTIGLALTYVIEMTHSLTTLVQSTSNLETNIVAVERIKEYADLPSEADWELPERKPPPDWPQEGEISFHNFSSRYRPGLSLALKNILLTVRPGENVGIVGRTGAGKSSLSLALFRMLEGTSGSICVDGTDIASIGLHDLRRRITVLPQNPVLFSGSVRMNLDPSDAHTDQDLWAALKHAHMASHIHSLPQGLAHDLSEGGRDFSSGQRQLLCLARSLLRKSRILILDEATAAVDMETDELIQRTVREEFSDCTILMIAHRLRTVLDCDRVAVMVDGELRENGSPGQLLKDSDSLFYKLARNAGLV